MRRERRSSAPVVVPSVVALLLHALRTRQSLAQLRASLALASACRLCQRLNDGRLLLQGVFACCDEATPTLNGRMYSKAELAREAASYAARHAKRYAFGAFGHPSAFAPAGGGYHATPAAAASHRVVALTWRGAALEGVVEPLPQPAGVALVRAFVAGAALGVSTRGWAQLQPAADAGGAACHVADFQLAAFDVVLQPATRGARLAPLAQRHHALCGRPAGVLLRDEGG